MTSKRDEDAAARGSKDASLPGLRESDIIFDWNSVEKVAPLARGRFTFFDETLRDGIQSPSVTDPKIDDKIRILHLLDQIGVDHLDIGLPGAGPRAVEDVTILAREIRDSKLRIKAACAARTHANDIRPVIEVSQKIGIPIEVMTFIGSSPVRQYAEEWSLDRILKLSAEAIDLAVSGNLPVTYVTEDTTRSRPETGRTACACATPSATPPPTGSATCCTSRAA
jgi:2-isopropylmalate synthase